MQASASRYFEGLKRREPGNVFQVVDDRTIAKRLFEFSKIVRIGGGDKNASVWRQVAAAETEDCHRVVHVLDYIANDDKAEAFSEIGGAGCVYATNVVPSLLQFLALGVENVHSDDPATKFFEAAEFPFRALSVFDIMADRTDIKNRLT